MVVAVVVQIYQELPESAEPGLNGMRRTGRAEEAVVVLLAIMVAAIMRMPAEQLLYMAVVVAQEERMAAAARGERVAQAHRE
jgi:hypothetical protein